jgi:two-component system, LuxR family, sensor kinase FixL
LLAQVGADGEHHVVEPGSPSAADLLLTTTVVMTQSSAASAPVARRAGRSVRMKGANPMRQLRSLLRRARHTVSGAVRPLASPHEDAVRRRFEYDELVRCRRGARFFCWFAIALLGLSALNSFAEEPEVFRAILRIRIATVCLLGVVLFLLGSRLGRRRPRELALLFVFIMGLMFHALAVAVPAQAGEQYDRMNLVVLGLAVLITWSASWAATACGIMVAVYVAGAMWGQPGETDFGHHLVRLIATSIVTVGATAIQERHRWREMVNLRALAHARVESRETHARYQLLIDTAGSAIVVLSPEYRILEFNREAEAIYGWRRADVLGRDYLQLFLPPERRRDVAVMIQQILAGATVQGFEGVLRARSGEERTILWNVRRLAGTGRHALGIVGVGQDITDRKRAEEQIRRLNEELEARVVARTAELSASEERAREHQAQLAHVLRVSTMGEMAAALAHEINQPLGAIVNYANGIGVRLREGGLATDDLQEAVTHIAAEGLRAGEIIRRVREFVRQGDANREPADVNRVVREAIHLIEPDARRSVIPIHLVLDSALVPIEIDCIQVEQVILNLLRNGLEAMTEADTSDHELIVRTSGRTAGTVEVSVRDTGIGVTPAARDRIFDPFFTTKAGGLGMGLSISRSIIEAHGGRLWATGNPDRGMTFGFTLPIRQRGEIRAA